MPGAACIHSTCAWASIWHLFAQAGSPEAAGLAVVFAETVDDVDEVRIVVVVFDGDDWF